MGLDMYLTAKLHTCKPFGENEKEKPIRIAVKKALPEIYSTGNIETIEISFEAAYWRKDNQIHHWFVENCQDGEDECKPHWVSREQLQKLLELCKEVMANKDKASELLPVQQGFFFGSYEYDEWYFEGIQSTIEQIEKALKLPDEWDFEYCSSW